MDLTAIILAAGKGSRLKSACPKPLHYVGGKPMVAWVEEAARSAGARRVLVVTGADNDAFIPHLSPETEMIVQAEPKGTGHAVTCCMEALQKNADNEAVLILYADTPLISAETIEALARAVAENLDLCALGFEADDPTGYGRMLVAEEGALHAIIEEVDADATQKAIRLVNGGVMAAKASVLVKLLPLLSLAPQQTEYYLTDLVKLAKAEGYRVGKRVTTQKELMGVNDRRQQAYCEALIQQRFREKALAEGVCMIAPETVFLSAHVQFGQDVTIEPHVMITGHVTIGDRTVIKGFSHLDGAIIGTTIGTDCSIGPYARLRPNTRLGHGVKIGNFVETKNAQIGNKAKASHLSYLGDTEIGHDSNIGAGTITCNYDGHDKAITSIGAYSFIGSNTALIAPVHIGDYAIIGAGSTIDKNVDDHAMSLTRSQQIDVKDGAKRFRYRKQQMKKNAPQ